MSSQERLNFMAKYSSNVYAAEMGMAVDLWAAIATEFCFIYELHTLTKKAHVSRLTVSNQKVFNADDFL